MEYSRNIKTFYLKYSGVLEYSTLFWNFLEGLKLFKIKQEFCNVLKIFQFFSNFLEYFEIF